MFNATFEISLLPRQVTLKRSRNLPCEKKENPAKILTSVAGENSQDWAIGACHELLASNRHSANLQVTFSDIWVRYDLIKLGVTEISDQDATSLARAQFSRHYPGADSASWPLRLARQGQQILVAGMNPSLLTALTQMAVKNGKKLVRVEPLFATVFDAHEKEIIGSEGWILFDEPGMLIAVFVEKEQMISLHCQRVEENDRDQSAHQLLERQAALMARPAGKVRIYSYSGVPLGLPEPWHVSQFRLVDPHGIA